MSLNKLIEPLTSPFRPATDEPCWWCGGALTSPVWLRRCRPCYDQHGPLSNDEVKAMIDASDKHEAWSRILADRIINRVPDRGPTPGAPERYAYAEAEGEVLAWAKCLTPRLLLLQGPTGTGKTWQAWGAIRASGQVGQCVKAAGLTWLDRDEFKSLATAPVLLLDDLASRTSPGALASALEVIDIRLDHERPTIVTTNAGFTELTAIEPRISSRLAGGRIIRLDGRDRRMPAKAAS